MISGKRVLYTVLLAAGVSAMGCTADTTTEDVGQSNDALSVYQWSANKTVSNNSSYDPSTIATYNWNGHDYNVIVHTGDDQGDTDMWWAISYDGVTWNGDQQISGMYTSSPARLASFNGYLYMVHQGGGGPNDHSVWMSRLDSSGPNWYWRKDYLIPYQSITTPGLVVANGALYIVGSTPGTAQLWYATMSTTETFSATTPVGQAFAGTPALTAYCPSAPNFYCFPTPIYMAYRTSNNDIMMSSYSPPLWRRAGGWSAPWVVTNGNGTPKLSGAQPAIAVYNNILHMIHTDPAYGDRIMWSYFDGSSWSNEVSIGSQRMYGYASLAPRADRLVMVHPSSVASHEATWPDFNTDVWGEYFQ